MRRIISILLLVTTALFVLSVQAQEETYMAPKTEWGQPDLQGVWNFSSNVPIQRPQRFGDRQFMTDDEVVQLRVRLAAADDASDQAVPGIESETNPGGYNDFWVESAGLTDRIRTSHIIYPTNGRFPDLVEGLEVIVGGLGPDVSGDRPVRFVVGGIGKDGPEDRGLSERCIVGFNSNPPFAPSLYNNNLQIVQNRDHVVILMEMIHDARIVPIGNRPALDEKIGLWSGDSRGYWDGNTLVVETNNFNGMTQSYEGMGTSVNKKLSERFTRIDAYTVNYEWTIDDPSTFADRVSAVIPMTKVAGQLYEYACHEGNYGMVNIVRGARAEDRRAEESSN